MAWLVHPHGQIGAAYTVEIHVIAIRRLVDGLAQLGFSGPAAQLSRAKLAEVFMSLGITYEAPSRHMLASLDDETSALAPDVRALVDGRLFNQRNRKSLPPYSEGEWSRLEHTCRSVAARSFNAYRGALSAAERGRHPTTGGWTPENVRWLLTQVGPADANRVGELMGLAGTTIRNKKGLPQALRELFPDSGTQVAYQLLFGAYTGVVPDGIEDLGVADLDWAGDATVL